MDYFNNSSSSSSGNVHSFSSELDALSKLTTRWMRCLVRIKQQMLISANSPLLVIFIVSCPKGFQWNGKANRCYSTKMYRDVVGTDIVGMCKDLHQDASPAEPRSSEKLQAIADRAGTLFLVLIGLKYGVNFWNKSGLISLLFSTISNDN